MLSLHAPGKPARSDVLQAAYAIQRGAASEQEARCWRVQQKSSSRAVLNELCDLSSEIMGIWARHSQSSLSYGVRIYVKSGVFGEHWWIAGPAQNNTLTLRLRLRLRFTHVTVDVTGNKVVRKANDCSTQDTAGAASENRPSLSTWALSVSIGDACSTSRSSEIWAGPARRASTLVYFGNREAYSCWSNHRRFWLNWRHYFAPGRIERILGTDV